MTYVVTAYRWGWLNGHQYTIYAGLDRAKAIALAQAENADRGGKYGCSVVEFTDLPDGQQDTKEVAYFPSSYEEKKAETNHRLDMFSSLGHKFYAFAEGEVFLPQEGTSVLKPTKVDPPSWVVAEKRRAVEECEILSGAVESRNG